MPLGIVDGAAVVRTYPLEVVQLYSRSMYSAEVSQGHQNRWYHPLACSVGTHTFIYPRGYLRHFVAKQFGGILLRGHFYSRHYARYACM